MTRRMASRTVTAVGTLSVFALLAACTDVADVVEVCAARTDPPTRVDDRYCEAPVNQAEASHYGWYQVQLPEARYDWDQDTYVYPTVVIVDVGHPLPRNGTAGSGGFVSGPTRATGTRVIRPPARAAGTPGATVGGSTISRGGLGVSGVSGSSGS